jgi:hypothetical protein
VERGALGALAGEPAAQQRQAGEDDGGREQPRLARDQAQPVRAAAEEQPERDDGGRVPAEAEQPLQADARAEDGEGGEGREAQRGDERVAAVGQVRPRAASAPG